MRLMNDERLDFTLLQKALERPELYQESSHPFWDDEYIASQMLKHHLDPSSDAASRRPDAIRKEAAFIVDRTGLGCGMTLLDLGCGPGLYVREFARSGAHAAGLDISETAVQYARKHVQIYCGNTDFQVGNYLEADILTGYDVMSLIYFDFCALSPLNQRRLLGQVCNALDREGWFVLDILTDRTRTEVGEKVTVSREGLWSPKPYLEIYQAFRYQSPTAEGFQYTIVGEQGDLRSMRIFHRLFSAEEIQKLLEECGFRIMERYADLAGRPWTEGSDTMALFCQKA